MDKTDIDLAYLSGFFDGEGSISFGFSRSTKQGITYWTPSIQVSICNTMKECMESLQKKYSIGHVYTTPNTHPRKGRDPRNWHEITTWRINSREDIRKFLDLIEPYVFFKKKDFTLCRKALSILAMEPSIWRDTSFRQIIQKSKSLKSEGSRGRKRKYERPEIFQ